MYPPPGPLALSLGVHQAPRRLKIGKAYGDAIGVLGRAILAGCKRSTQLARAYTLRMVRRLAADFGHVDLHQHVDDMTVFIKPAANHLLAEEAYSYINDFADEARKLKMEILKAMDQKEECLIYLREVQVILLKLQ